MLLKIIFFFYFIFYFQICGATPEILVNISNEVDSNEIKVSEFQVTLQDPITFSTKITNCSTKTNKKINIILSNLSKNVTHVMCSEKNDFANSFWTNVKLIDNKIMIPFLLSSLDGIKTVYVKIKNSDSKEETKHSTIILDTKEPSKIQSFFAKSDILKMNLSWTTPNDKDYYGAIIKYSTEKYPLTINAGILLNTYINKPNETLSIVHENLSSKVLYYYSIFSYDKAGNYSMPSFAKGQPLNPNEGFSITAPSIVMAGEDFGVTIQVLRADGTLNYSYSANIDLSIEYLNPSSGQYTFYHTKPVFDNGIANITMNYQDAGFFKIKGIGTQGSSIYGESNQILSAPAEFKIETPNYLLKSEENFSLIITPLNAFFSPTPNYKNEDVQLAFELLSPLTGKGLLNTSRINISGITTIENITFNEVGKIKLTLSDTTYIPGIEITGTSNEITLIPAKLEITHINPYKLRPFYYIDEPFDISVNALSIKENITENYQGTIILNGDIDAISKKPYTFTKNDKGRHTFSNLKGTKDGDLNIKITDSTYSEVYGKLNNIQIKFGQIKVIDAKGSIGEIETKVVIENKKGELINNDNSTEFTIDFIDPNNNHSIITDFNKVLKVQEGSLSIKISNNEAETILATPYTRIPLKTKTGEIMFMPSYEISPFETKGGVRILFWKEQRE